MNNDDIAANFETVRAAIARAAREGGRAPDPVTLVAVSKTQDDAKIDAALAAGQRVFGENRVQEAQARWQDRRAAYPGLSLHLIGPLQTNKIRAAVALFDVIQTLDRPELARGLAAEMVKQGRALPCFIQVNTGREPQKSGVMPEEAADFLALCRDARLAVRGLMCIPPAHEEPAPHFTMLRAMAARLGLPELSMGMSGDYEEAVRCGATCVRVGTALFGARAS
jgi:pyridoxal phosphate enzyme (YggS family)